MAKWLRHRKEKTGPGSSDWPAFVAVMRCALARPELWRHQPKLWAETVHKELQGRFDADYIAAAIDHHLAKAEGQAEARLSHLKRLADQKAGVPDVGHQTSDED